MYHWVEHTADLALEVRADGPLALLVEAIAALTQASQPKGADLDAMEGRSGALDLHEGTLEEILVNLMNEHIFQWSVRGLLMDPVQVARRGHLEDSDGAWTLTVASGLLYRRPRGGRPASDHLKAATHHGLSIQNDDGAWTATVVIDV